MGGANAEDDAKEEPEEKKKKKKQPKVSVEVEYTVYETRARSCAQSNGEREKMGHVLKKSFSLHFKGASLLFIPRERSRKEKVIHDPCVCFRGLEYAMRFVALFFSL